MIGMSVAGYAKGILSLSAVFTVSGVLFLIAVLILLPLLGTKEGADKPFRADYDICHTSELIYMTYGDDTVFFILEI